MKEREAKNDSRISKAFDQDKKWDYEGLGQMAGSVLEVR